MSEGILRQYGLNDKQVTDTLKNQELTAALVQLHSKFGADKRFYTVATKVHDERHRDLLAKYITESKLVSALQIESGISFLSKHPETAEGDDNFEKSCGVGVTITDVELEQAVLTKLQEIKETILEERYQFNLDSFLGKLKRDDHLKWADAGKLKQQLEHHFHTLVGPRTEADDAAKAKKKEKPKKEGEKEKERKGTPEANQEVEMRTKMREAAEAVMHNLKYRSARSSIHTLLENAYCGLIPEDVLTVAGWIRTIRDQGTFWFIELNDGSGPKHLQVVVETQRLGNAEQIQELQSQARTGACIEVKGPIIKSPGKGQLIEMQATELTVIGTVGDNYPIAKAAMPLEVLRQHLHLRIRTSVMGSVMRIRNACAFAIHKFYQERGFNYVHTPLITSNDCEGAGECFTVTTLLKHDQPTAQHIEDFSKDFFGRRAMLTVSGQLNVETYCAALTNVYTFGPTFRAELSNTTRHLAEFWMIEPEIWFAGLADLMQLAEDFLKYVIAFVLQHCQADLLYLDAYHLREAEEQEAAASASGADAQSQGVAKSRHAEGHLVDRLLDIVKAPFARITYTEAIELLKKAEAEGAVSFSVKPEWGMDMGSEHERYICEVIMKRPTITTHYPKQIKAFYMKQSDDGKTVEAMDILVPNIGEIIGGSAREDKLERLEANMQEKSIPVGGLQWYLDLRRYASAPHAGFGLGFERLLLLVTGMHNIRDVIPFPRYPGNAQY